MRWLCCCQEAGGIDGAAELTSSVERVYIAVSFRVNGAYLLAPAAFKAAVSVCRTTPTWNQAAAQYAPQEGSS